MPTWNKRAGSGTQTGNPKNVVGIFQEYKDPGRHVCFRFLLDA